MICVKPSYSISFWSNLGPFALDDPDCPDFRYVAWSRRPLHYCLEDI